MKVIRLRPGKDKSLLRRHPWVFEGAVAKGTADSGETVRIESHEGRFLAWAAFSPASRIRARIWSFEEAERIDADFFADRVARAIQARSLWRIQSDALRLIHGESDGLPGLVVDRYGDTLVVQLGSCGPERWKSLLCKILLKETGLGRLYERSDGSVRSLEGLPERSGWLAGDGPCGLVLQEHGWRLGLDVARGHKTGFYLDQRDNRQRFFQWTEQRRFEQVLNCFCYTGGFTVAALAGGADFVTSIDSSAPALEQARANLRLNALDESRTEMIDADVNASLRQFLQQGRRFDAIVLDPPKLAPTAVHAERAARAYKDLNRLALQLLVPGGVLFTFSCSGGISVDLFHKIVASAGIDAGVDAFISERLGAAPDHPLTVYFPEGEYLKGLVLVRKP